MGTSAASPEDSLSALVVPQPALPRPHVSVPYTALSTLTCASDDNCLAIGEWQWSNSTPLQPIAVEETNGVWSSTILPWPPDDDAKLHLQSVSTPSCSSPGNCAAAMGLIDESDPSKKTYPEGVLLESSGNWSAFELPSQYSVGVTSLACPSNGICYLTVYGLPDLVELDGSTLSTAAVNLPSGSSIATIGSLSCSTVSCIAVGSLAADAGTQAAVFVEQNLDWSAVVIPQPTGIQSGLVLSLQRGACDPTGQCVVLGDDYAGSGSEDLTIDASGSDSGSAWTSALAPSPFPTGSFSDGTTFDWLQCPASGQCLAGGEGIYAVGGQAGQGQDQLYMLDDLGGTWGISSASAAQALPVEPPGWPPVACSSVTNCALIAQSQNPNTTIVGGTQGWDYPRLRFDSSSDAVACVDGGSCAAVQLSADGRPEVFAQAAPGGAWTTPEVANPYVPSSPEAAISSVSCATTSLCAGAGTTVLPGQTSLVYYSMVDRTWSASLAPLPAGAAPYSPEVDCAQNGSVCVGDDDYVIDVGNTPTSEAIVSSYSSGSWGSTYVASLLPGNAAASPNVFLSRPSCSTSGFCVITGSYEDDAVPPAQVYFMMSETTPGDWVESTIPIAAYAVSCPVADWCAATAGANDVYVLSAGTWRLASSLPGGGLITCWAKGNCIAVQGGHSEAAESDNNGTWTELPALPPPADATTLSCDDVGNCVVAGGALLATDSRGGAFSVVPSGDQPGPVLTTVEGSSCSPTGGCAVVGGYQGGAQFQPVIASGILGGFWNESTTPVADSGDWSELHDVSCPAGSASQLECVAVGTEDNNAPAVPGTPGAFALVVSSHSPLTEPSGFVISATKPSPVVLDQTATFTAHFAAELVPGADRLSQLLGATARQHFNPGLRVRAVERQAEASCTISTGSQLAIGSDTVTATYWGDANYSGSSSSVDYTVTVWSTNLLVTGLPEGTYLSRAGAKLQLDIVVDGTYVIPRQPGQIAQPPTAPTATGIVSVQDDCAATLANGRALCQIPDSDLRSGEVHLSVTYAGDPNYEGLTVTEPPFEIVVTPRFETPASRSIDVLERLSFLIKTAGSPDATINEIGTLPKGVKLQALPGGHALLSGTPALHTKGDYSFRLVAFNGTTSVQEFRLKVISEPPSIDSASSITGRVGRRLSFIIRGSGIPAPTISVSGSLPAGVRFVPSESGHAMLEGTPRQNTEGTYQLTLMARNGLGHKARERFSLKVVRT